MRPAPIRQVIAVHARDHRVTHLHAPHRLRRVRGLKGVEVTRRPLRDRAEPTPARAHIPHQHKGRRPRAPALVDVGAAGLLAHRHEVQPVLERLDLLKGVIAAVAHAQPVGAGAGLALTDARGGGVRRERGLLRAGAGLIDLYQRVC